MDSDSRCSDKQGATVLLVDDEAMVLDVGQAILERLGHMVITAMSGEDALEKFTAHRQVIGCVVLDLTMPGMDGIEIFQALRKLDPDIPIIIASGLTVDQVSVQFNDVGIQPTSIIQKPYQVANLSSQIQNIFNRSI